MPPLRKMASRFGMVNGIILSLRKPIKFITETCRKNIRFLVLHKWLANAERFLFKKGMRQRTIRVVLL